jgi:hypothetical protein
MEKVKDLKSFTAEAQRTQRNALVLDSSVNRQAKGPGFFSAIPLRLRASAVNWFFSSTSA